MFNDEANFVSMGFEHEDVLGSPFHRGPSGTVGVALDFIGEAFHIVSPNALSWHFPTSGARGLEKFEEEFLVGLGHEKELRLRGGLLQRLLCFFCRTRERSWRRYWQVPSLLVQT